MAIRGLPQRCDELFLQHLEIPSKISREQQIEACSGTKALDLLNLGLSELMTHGEPEPPDLIIKQVKQSRSQMPTTNMLLISSIVRHLTYDLSMCSLIKVNSSSLVSELIFKVSPSTASTPMHRPLDIGKVQISSDTKGKDLIMTNFWLYIPTSLIFLKIYPPNRR
ncbi:hypothetical protein Syun_019112 [Stephania yunnanensis]|uniref:Uncharacterized protein n=1 Tax=Stephania yunnanensis TaxID=152371 RepID=A0AAP0NXN3_9MAGN